MKGWMAGLGILLLLGAAGYLVYTQMGRPSVVELKGVIGSEKTLFLQNEQVRRILKEKYGFVLNVSSQGSLEMVRPDPAADLAFLWPSSQIPLELFKTLHGGKLLKSDLVFSSPIVFYSWDLVETAFLAQNLIAQKDGVTYLPDLPGFFGRIEKGQKWSEVGLPDLYGRLNVISTDPVKSNSGMMFSGLLASTLVGDVPDAQTIQRVLPQVKQYFGRLGFMQSSTGFLFEQYLKTGVGQFPLIAGYESQLVEFALQNPELWQKVKTKLRIFYPTPTVWSEHPLIILDPRAVGLIAALKDPEIQKIAWEHHGFRTALAGAPLDPKVLGSVGIPETLVQIVPMPPAPVMETLLDALQP